MLHGWSAFLGLQNTKGLKMIQLSKEQLFQMRLYLVAVKAASFTAFAGGSRVCQDKAAAHAKQEFKKGGSAANAINEGYQFGMSAFRKQNVYQLRG